MDWDNLRFFLEIARAGRLTLAARRLNVDHTTVSRRLQHLENELGSRLFNKESSGYHLTEAGRRLLNQAEAMESACLGIAREASQVDAQLSGLVRIGATEGFGASILAPLLGSFAATHPRLTLDLLAVPRAVKLSRREADIVIAVERPSEGPFIITLLSDYVLRLYASPDYLAHHPAPGSVAELSKHAFIGYINDLLFSKELDYLDEVGSPERVVLRSTSLYGQMQAAVAGAGIAILPAFMASREPRLQVLMPDQVSIRRTFWMMMPVDIKDLARMRAIWDYIRLGVEGDQDLLLGRG